MVIVLIFIAAYTYKQYVFYEICLLSKTLLLLSTVIELFDAFTCIFICFYIYIY